MANTYTPAANSVASRVVAWLHARPSGEYNAAQIAEALKVDPKIIASSLEVALRHKLVFHRQRIRGNPRAPWWYSATDRSQLQRMQGFGASSTWMPAPKINRKDAEESGSSPGTPGASGTPEVSCASSAEAAAADAPSGDQGAAAGADRAAAPTPNTSAPGSQQVLKAEAARPDATDRETPDTASPGVGPMGAGQPADAGPTCEDQRSGGHGTRPCADEQSEGHGRHAPVAAPGWRESSPLHHDEQPREVDAQFAASLRAAMHVDVDDDCLARGAELGRRKSDQLSPADLAATRRAVHAPLAFRAARFSDGSLHFERHGQVIASLTADEVDVLVQLLGARA